MTGLLAPTQIERLLHSEWIGRIGCYSRERTYVVPVTYVYDGTAIYGQTGHGLKVGMMRENPRVCFEIDHSPDIATWQSVIVQGRYEELQNEAAQSAVALLMTRLGELTTSEGRTPPHGAGRLRVGSEDAGPRLEVIYRIVVEERTGRFEHP